MIRHYLPAEYGGSDQIFGIAQTAAGEMLFADVNDRVIWRFDGALWRPIEMPAFPLVLATGSNPQTGERRIWVGAAGDLGYLEEMQDPARTMRFVSLHDQIPAGPCLENDRFDDLVPTDDGVFFGQNSALLRWRDGVFTCWQPPGDGAFGWTHSVGGRLLVGARQGQFELIDDELVELPNWGRAAAEIELLPDGRWLVLRHGERAVEIYDPRSDSHLAVEGELHELLQDYFVQNLQTLDDGRLAVSLGRGGAVVLSPDAEIQLRLDASNGLPGGESYRLFVSRDGLLWSSLARGVAAIDLDSPVQMFPAESSISGYLTDLLVHQSRLYATTFDGVFWIDLNPADAAAGSATFSHVSGDVLPGTDSWMLEVLGDGELYAVTDSGVARISGTGAGQEPTTKLLSSRGPLWIGALEVPDRVLAIGNQRLQVMATDGEPWRVIYRRDLPNYAAFAVAESARRFWIIGDGLLTLAEFATPDFDEPPLIESFREEVEWYGINFIGGRLTAWGSEGPFVLREGQPSEDPGSWTPDERFADLDLQQLLEHPAGYGLDDDLEGGAWVSTAFGFERWTPREGSARLANDPEQGLWGTRIGSALVDPESPGVLWFEREGVVFRFDAQAVATREAPSAPPLISRTLPQVAMAADADPANADVLPYSRRTVRFEFSSPRFMNPERTEYRVLLDGYDDEWTQWSRETRKDYTRLQEGSYRFRVQARVAGSSLGESSYALRVLPPWYRSFTFRLLVTLALLVVLGLAAWLLRRRVRLQQQEEYRARESLEALVTERTHQLQSANLELERLAVTDSLTGIHNRRFLREALPRDLEVIERQLAQGKVPQGLTFVLIDLNGFKQVNDSYGHGVGDRVLEGVALRLQAACRESDYIVRWGGDEFLVVCRSAKRREVPEIANRIAQAITEEPFLVRGVEIEQNLHVAASIGFCVLPLSAACDLSQEPERSLEIADRCLYLAKQARPSGWCGVLSSSREPIQHGQSSRLDLKTPGVEIVASRDVYSAFHAFEKKEEVEE